MMSTTRLSPTFESSSFKVRIRFMTMGLIKVEQATSLGSNHTIQCRKCTTPQPTKPRPVQNQNQNRNQNQNIRRHEGSTDPGTSPAKTYRTTTKKTRVGTAEDRVSCVPHRKPCKGSGNVSLQRTIESPVILSFSRKRMGENRWKRQLTTPLAKLPSPLFIPA